jgi:septal ring factor EnvC (AmiA/AmiB activator)
MDDLDYAHDITRFDLDIKELEIILENLISERKATNTFLQDTTTELKSITETLDNLHTQLDMLNGKEEDLRSTRDEEQVAYQHRTQNNNKVL